MIEQNARVVSVLSATTVQLEVFRQTSCQSCQQGCGANKLAFMNNASVHYLEASTTLSLASGDDVIVAIPEHQLWQAVGWLYVLPLSICVLLALIGQYWAGEGAAILGAVLGFATGCMMSHYLQGHPQLPIVTYKKEKLSP
ncbi:SoxR reducing system RseC family protein [Agitococcus lubricus]|uniref:RseC/MucC-like positive regulator of sigma(E) n=1 Tax=Agitococcus lubricus TaxID=1077255 RepID=A0A2T5J063_9GAMM|nr:SoxR reducing system RseC family protein [Agitococcus lubricus]PTQ89732.1 RseC/MucC-like positive regulator of sigma(E) [Agitococcus lubricus]